MRTPEDPALDLAIPIPYQGNVAKEIFWQKGLRDWCKRLEGPKEISSGLFTVEAITPKYAPSSDGNSPAKYAAAVNRDVAAWVAEGTAPAPKPTTRWRCINKQGVNLRSVPNVKGRLTGLIKYGDYIEVGLVKIDSDVETISGDNHWL